VDYGLYWRCSTAGGGTPTKSPIGTPIVTTISPVITDCKTINGERDASGIWISLADENSAKCICGTGNYFTQYGKWYCGKEPGSTSTPIITRQPIGTAVQEPTNTVAPVNTCRECPTTFQCYTNGKEYKWFVNGYVMAGFNAVPAAQISACGVKPTYRGKAHGDANCDGFVDVTDFSQWYKEYFDGGKGTIIKTTWEADFTGDDGGKCDQKVSVIDYSLWYKYFTELKGGN